MTNKELKKAIKNKLIEAGYTKGYTLSVRDCGYSTAVRITVNDPTVNRSEIEKAAKSFEEYERDIDGEILQGGNTYVMAEWKIDVFNEIEEAGADEAAELMAEAEANKISELTKIADGLWILNEEHGGRLELMQQNKADHCRRYIYDSGHLAQLLYKFRTFGTIAV